MNGGGCEGQIMHPYDRRLVACTLLNINLQRDGHDGEHEAVEGEYGGCSEPLTHGTQLRDLAGALL